MSGILSVVATPIGHLEDITLRALRVLRDADLIAAEDTRRTARLLRRYDIGTPTTSLHEHNEARKLPWLLGRLAKGARVALVSDAGTPTLSDPGQRLVREALRSGITVESIPGPSAIAAALAVSGLPGDAFLFLGFPPAKSSDRISWLSSAGAEARTLVLFEAPHRIRDTLQDMLEVWGDREIVVARELTKAHEELVVGPITACLSRLTRPRGEFTIVVSGRPEDQRQSEVAPTDEQIYEIFGQSTELLGSRRAAIKRTSELLNLPARQVYAAVERQRPEPA